MSKRQTGFIANHEEPVACAETSEGLFQGALNVLQASDGYRYSIDPFLLSEFVAVPQGARVMDLGSGSGILLLLLSARKMAGRLAGLELQPALVERSRRSIEMSGLEQSVEIFSGDVRELPEQLAPESFEVVVTNPPYRPASSGRLAPGNERSRARHELAGGLDSFLRSASFLLKTGGRFFVIYLAERLPELLAEMRCFRLEAKRLRLVFSREGDDARLVMVEGRKNARPGLRVVPPLVIYQGATGADYTDEVAALYKKHGLARK